ncbi:uncharacterized protein LOC106141431 [Amyelois transitella]|uniref:uncharacterized protein LOC106141431 n=1 Tax=Amyelois transitella TaxID=680683 RepID=UPI00298F9C47|nr:uncharacterized protein LOC106141431 [Amyelois transitella]
MVELSPQTKNQEERPLLKVEGASGDGGGRQMPPTDTAWSVTCSTRRSWWDRWPEFLTAFWMTGILLAISFLVMYVLTIGSVKRQPVVILKCNSSNPYNEVYYHQIVQRQNSEMMSMYSDYLAEMATKYPLLHFNVIFMIDDTIPNNGRYRHINIYGRLIPIHTRDAISNFEYYNSKKIKEFQQKYHNVNVTVIPLSRFMARTLLRYKWRTIPTLYLSFYARIFAVWQTGGIGMDLPTFNYKYKNHLDQDSKITSILKQHNDGIKADDYKRALEYTERNEENEIYSAIFEVVNQMITNFFNSSYWFPSILPQKDLTNKEPLVRTYRNKRDVPLKVVDNYTSINDTKDFIKFGSVNATNDNAEKHKKPTGEYISLNKTTFNMTERNLIKLLKGGGSKLNNTVKPTEKHQTTTSNVLARNDNYVEPNMFMSYQISVLSDDLGMMNLPFPNFINMESPLFNFGKTFDKDNLDKVKYDKSYARAPNFLTLTSEGSFAASTAVMHPLLGHLLSCGCKRMSPRISIQEAFLSQCAESIKDDLYCDNIYLLNLI